MTTWDANHYLQFGGERTRPAVDLAARVDVNHPETVIDLGCGPGNSTQVLRRRWPEAHITGLDSSPAMIAAARASYPEQEWVLASAEEWSPPEPFDVVFSNAALQWIGDHAGLMSRLFAQVAAGGALAFQIPSRSYSAVRAHIDDVADDTAWRERMWAAKAALTLEDPAYYYDALSDQARRLDIWETEYIHIMDGPSSIVDWVSSTGLRPFLNALDTHAERQRFVDLLQTRVAECYARQRDGKVLFPFRRLFVVAYR
jgi:trans-aconitate 2-methyltransferase